MEGPSILLNDPKGAAPRKPAPDFMQGWSLLLWMGWLFLIVGLANLVLIWVPLRLGVPEYEFGAAANSLDSLPCRSWVWCSCWRPVGHRAAR